MKNKLLRLVFTSLIFGGITTNTWAQDAEGAEAKCVEKGSFLVDVYYGFPNVLLNAVRKELAESNYNSASTYTSFGPIGIRGEYFVANHVALGVEVNYSAATINWDENETGSISNPKIIKHELAYTRLRMLAKFSFHFGPNEKLDFYTGGGIGTNRTVFTELEDGISTSGTYTTYYGALTTIPISWRINFGAKYYFTKNIGAGAEVGFCGAPLASLGICFKF